MNTFSDEFQVSNRRDNVESLNCCPVGVDMHCSALLVVKYSRQTCKLVGTWLYQWARFFVKLHILVTILRTFD